MKRLFFVLMLVSFALWLASCSEEPNQPQNTPGSHRVPAVSQPNPAQPSVPKATVPLLTFTAPKDASSISTVIVPAVLTPPTLTKTLQAGESVTEAKNLYLPPTVSPKKLDLLIAFDLTGSMGEELENVKANSVNIMNAIKVDVPDSKFGVVSHMDYTGTFTGCDYSDVYGMAGGDCNDYPYSLNQGLTDNTGDVSTAINGLVLGCGYDGPEDYTRVLYESYSDPGIVWRSGAKKIVLAFLDAIPHDCAVDAVLGGSPPYTTTGPDPGRDATAGNGDDLAILPVLDAMAADNVTLITVYSGGYGAFGKSLWDAFTAKTTGSAFEINSDGTIPGGMDIADFIAGLVGESIVHFDEVTLKACDPTYAGWISSVVPASYTDVDLGTELNEAFDLTITVPPGTEPGEYCFDVCAVGDGVELATQAVCITVVNTVEVGFDFHPTSCPNPFNMDSEGISPAAIVGMGDFNVMTIDPASIRLEGVPAVRWAFDDVVKAYTPITGKDDCLDCTNLGPDGFLDLTLKFDSKALAAAMAGAKDRDCRVVRISGYLKAEYGGNPIAGEDVLKIIVKPPRPSGGMTTGK